MTADHTLAIKENVPLAPYTSFGIGGPARWFVQPSNLQELEAALSFAKQRAVPYYILGGGTNVLISDKGFDGLVIRMGLDTIRMEGEMVTAQAGAPLAAVVDTAADCGASGIEWLAGIPGTIGGGIRGNAGAYGATIGEFVAHIIALDAATGEPASYTRDECRFAYRTSLFKSNPHLIVISTTLQLSAGKPGEIRARMKEILRKRGAIMENEKSVGSYFVNPVPEDEQLIQKFEADRKIVCRNCMIPAGWFIDRAGLRGTRVGGAMVSEKHGNYLINTGTASAADMVNLARLIKQRVLEEMGIELQEEVNYVGF